MRETPHKPFQPILLLALPILLLNFTPSDLLAAEPDGQWHLDANLGLWGLAADGTVGVGRVQADVDLSFSDLIEHTNFAAMGGIELTKSNWVVDFNGIYAELSGNESGPRDLVDIDVDAQMGIADLAVGYTLVRTKLGTMPLTLTPALGVRYTYLSLELDPERLRSVSNHEDWWDPYVGGRVVLSLTPNLNWRTEGTIGGFSVGSDLTWSAATYLDWKLSKSITLNIGYRALAWDFENANFEWDITMHGPWLGLTINLF
ncbi:MAG TPA: hypothetical protein VHP11_04940 [Tepidisphaeraceae bacterium]|nr:hypothetical protein [Tepidisphaeraceae bacterium]